jgi:hypothetical protein
MEVNGGGVPAPASLAARRGGGPKPWEKVGSSRKYSTFLVFNATPALVFACLYPRSCLRKKTRGEVEVAGQEDAGAEFVGKLVKLR